MANENTHNCCCRGREEIELSEGVRPLAVLVDEDCDCECGEVELYTSKEPDVLLFEEYCEEYADDIVLAKEAAIAAKEAVNTNAATIIAKENLLLDDHQTIKRELRQGIIDIRADIAAALAELKTKIQNGVADIKSRIDSKTTEIKNHVSDKYALLNLAIADARDTVLGSIGTAKTAIDGAISTGIQAVKDKIDAGVTTLGGAISSALTTLQGNISTAKQELSSKIDALQFPTFEECTEQEILDMFPVEEN